MARRVKVLQIERVIPNLIHTTAGEILFTNLEFDNKDDVFNQQHNVDALSKARNDKLKVGFATPREFT